MVTLIPCTVDFTYKGIQETTLKCKLNVDARELRYVALGQV